jgi:hypothetical protein
MTVYWTLRFVEEASIQGGQAVAPVKPFDAHGWFPIHNAVFDTIMPGLSPEAWKALCVALRQTWGLPDTDGGGLSCSQFQAKMGNESQETVSRALQECLETGYLVRHEIGEEQGEPIYALNFDFEIGGEDKIKVEDEVKVAGNTGNGMEPSDQFLVSAWRLATGDELTSDGLDALTELLSPDLVIGTLANVILELGRRVDNLTTELVQAVAVGKMSMPSLEELEEPPQLPELPHGPVMATTSTTETDPVLAQVIGMYENEIGLVTEGTAQHLMALTAEHRDITKWREAFDAVVQSNVRRLDYLVKCLENVGKPKPKRKPGQRGRGYKQRQERTVREKPPAEDVDAETRARQRAALAELKRRQREQK